MQLYIVNFKLPMQVMITSYYILLTLDCAYFDNNIEHVKCVVLIAPAK